MGADEPSIGATAMRVVPVPSSCCTYATFVLSGENAASAPATNRGTRPSGSSARFPLSSRCSTFHRSTHSSHPGSNFVRIHAIPGI